MGFEEYVAEQGQALLRFACVLTTDPHRAEDLTQTVLADVYRRWRRVSSARNPDAYVRRMMVNAHLDWHRRRSSTETVLDLTDREVPGDADPADRISTRHDLRSLLDTLAPRARTVLVLRYYADLDDTAIAEAMGISPSTVRATRSRALATLRGRGAVSTLEETP